MRSSVTSSVVLAGFVAGLASFYGCSSGSTGGSPNPFTQAGASSVAGTTSASGSTGMSGSPATGGSGNTAGSGTGGASTAGSSTGGAATAGTGGQSMAGAGGGSGGSGGGDITKVWKSMGCAKAFAGQSGAKITIPTKGMKDANCADKINNKARCGLWGQAGNTWVNDNQVPCPNGDCTQPVMRDYYVNLPANYDMNKAYTLVFEGPGCGGGGQDVYPLNNNADGTIIRVGLTPPPSYIGHGTNENQGCFDDKEGDDSIDWVFYENLYDKLNNEICFDRNRVFSAGNSSGSWFSNELGCKYAGDPMRPVRGVMPNTGGLPNQAQWEPTCTTKPMAGMWIHEVGDTTNPFTGNKFAIARAMKVNGCTGAMDYDAAVAANAVQNFPIGGGQPDDTCKLIKNCPALYPLVVCALPGTAHGSHDPQANNGFSTFVKQFSTGAFVTQ
jgi:poly(3-hydroxybutyrate) depolymerase